MLYVVDKKIYFYRLAVVCLPLSGFCAGRRNQRVAAGGSRQPSFPQVGRVADLAATGAMANNARQRGLYRQIKEHDRLSEELGRMTKLSENLLSSVPQSVGDEAEKELPGDRQQRELVARLHEYLLKDGNFAKPDINPNELAPELITNRSYLFEAVKTVTGKTLQEYIYSLRIEMAKQKLETDLELTIETLVRDCGFNSRSVFYRFFRKQYGVSPAEYRKMVKRT